MQTTYDTETEQLPPLSKVIIGRQQIPRTRPRAPRSIVWWTPGTIGALTWAFLLLGLLVLSFGRFDYFLGFMGLLMACRIEHALRGW